MSNKSMPSLAALLGLIAVAGYQNRDKIGQVLQDAKGKMQDGSQEGGGGILGTLGGLFGGAESGSLSGGLGELIDRFKTGNPEVADSWVNPGSQSQGISPDQVEASIGKETLEDLAQKTGLDYRELLERLSTSIPDAVDKLTPDGQLPKDDAQVSSFFGSPKPANI